MTAEHRKSIVMFADVSGSAALFQRLGDKEAMHAVERCLKRMTRAIDGHRGKTLQIVGDEMLAIFDSAEDARHAAIDMQQRIADLPPISGLKLTIRIGLHAGTVTQLGDKATGPAINTAARIAGIARRDQILCSSALIGELSPTDQGSTRPMPDLGVIEEEGMTLEIFQIQWPSHQGVAQSIPPHQGPADTTGISRLCVRHHGKAFLVDEKTPVLSIGRDPGCKLVIEDRKASRQHGRIERRGNRFYLVDTSTNGSFVMPTGGQEILLRHHEMVLEGSGRITFGGSSNDLLADSAEFEYL